MSTAQPATSVRLHKLVQAPAQRVYDAWLDPQQIKQWWSPGGEAGCTDAQVDARVGGTFRIAMGDAEGAPAAAGTYLELDPPRRIVMTWGWEQAPEMAPGSQLTLELNEIDNPHEPGTRATEIVLTHDRLNTALSRSEHTGGWWNCLRALGYYVRGVDPREAMYAQAPAASE